MKSQTALVRADCGVELNTVCAVNMHLTVIVNPRNTETENSFRLNKSFKKREFSVFFLVCLDYGTKRIKHFADRLKKFRLIAVSLLQKFHYFINICHNTYPLQAKARN